MKHTLIAMITMALVFDSHSQNPVVESKAYDWKNIDAKAVDPEGLTTIFKGPSDGFEYIDAFVTSIDGGDSFELPGRNHDLESLVIMKTGSVEQLLGGKNKRMGPGSVTLVMPGEKLKVNNREDLPASFYVVRWKVKNLPANNNLESDESISSRLISWTDLKYEKTEKGGRRHVIREPTVMLQEFEMHVTTLQEGMRSHPPHTHLDEEIILVRYGDVEESIDGKLYEVGEGSLIFLRSMVPHGIRNVGKGPCEYYAFRWIPRK